VRRTLMILALVAVGAVSPAGCAGGGADGGAAAGGPGSAAPTTTEASGSGPAGGGAGRGGYGDRSEPTSSRGTAATDADADDVRLQGFAFNPRTVSARTGQRIKWEHRDTGVTHTVTATGGEFRSGDLEEGDEFSQVFETAGTYAYRCSIHPDMRGTVRVGG